MKLYESLMYYSDHEIKIEDKDILSWIRYLCGHGVSFYIIICREENKAYAICTTPEQATTKCMLLESKNKGKHFIYDYIHNNQ